jgi:transposase InsO family protein
MPSLGIADPWPREPAAAITNSKIFQACRKDTAYLRSDNGSQFTARRVKEFLEEMGVATLFVAPGSPWENGYAESFNSRMRDELLDGELFLHIDEMKYVVERWRMACFRRERLCAVLEDGRRVALRSDQSGVRASESDCDDEPAVRNPGRRSSARSGSRERCWTA